MLPSLTSVVHFFYCWKTLLQFFFFFTKIDLNKYTLQKFTYLRHWIAFISTQFSLEILYSPRSIFYCQVAKEPSKELIRYIWLQRTKMLLSLIGCGTFFFVLPENFPTVFFLQKLILIKIFENHLHLWGIELLFKKCSKTILYIVLFHCSFPCMTWKSSW